MIGQKSRGKIAETGNSRKRERERKRKREEKTVRRKIEFKKYKYR